MCLERWNDVAAAQWQQQGNSQSRAGQCKQLHHAVLVCLLQAPLYQPDSVCVLWFVQIFDVFQEWFLLAQPASWDTQHNCFVVHQQGCVYGAATGDLHIICCVHSTTQLQCMRVRMNDPCACVPGSALDTGQATWCGAQTVPLCGGQVCCL